MNVAPQKMVQAGKNSNYLLCSVNIPMIRRNDTANRGSNPSEVSCKNKSIPDSMIEQVNTLYRDTASSHVTLQNYPCFFFSGKLAQTLQISRGKKENFGF